jgi:hypothetical protein
MTGEIIGTILIFLLFVALTFVLARNLLKLFAERRLGVLGSKFRTRLVVGGLLLSFLPVIMMFWFAYGLMNRSLDKWFSRPVEEVREDTAAVASLVPASWPGPGGSRSVTVHAAVPKKLTKEQRRIIEQLAKELPQEKFRARPREDEQDERNLFDRVKDMFG